MDTLLPSRPWYAALVSTPDTKVHHARRGDYVWLGLILLLAAALRFYRLDVADWSQDHSDIALLAQNVYYGNGLPLLGQPSSAVIPNSAYYIYPVVTPIGLSTNPAFLAACTALWGLLTVLLIWVIGLRYIGSIAGAAAALAYAVNPWVIGYSRSLWSGDHRATLVTLGILLGLLGFREGKRWAQLLCFPALFVGIQVHYAAWTLLPLYPLILWLWPRRIAWRIVLISVGIGLLTLAPYVVGLYRTAMESGGVLQAPTPVARELCLREIIKPIGQMFWLATGTGTENYNARASAAELRSLAVLPPALWWLLAPAIVVGFVGLLNKKEWRLAALFAAWIGVPLAAFVAPLIGVYPHYFIPVVPALALSTGAGIAFALESIPARAPLLRGAVAAGVLGIFGSQALFWPAAVRFIDTHYAPSQFSTATPSHYLMDVVAALRSMGAGLDGAAPKNVVFFTSDDWLEQSRTGFRVFAPFLQDTGATLRGLRVSDNAAVVSSHLMLVAVAPRVEMSTPLVELCERGEATSVPLRPGEGSYTIYSMPPFKLDEGCIPAHNDGPGPIRVECATLAGGVPTLVWQCADFELADATYEVDFEDAAGALVERVAMSFPDIRLMPGERLITWLDHAPPANVAALKVHILSKQKLQDGEAATEIGNALVRLHLHS